MGYKLWWRWRLTFHESYATFGIIVFKKFRQKPALTAPMNIDAVEIPSV